MRLRVDQRFVGCQRADLVQREWLAEREQFDRAPVIRGQPVHPLLDQVDERRTGGEAAVEPPETGRTDERAGLDRAADELADVQRVPAADLGDPVERGLLHWIVESGLDQRADVLVA